MQPTRSGALGLFIVAAGVLGTSWLALREMNAKLGSDQDAPSSSAPIASGAGDGTRDPSQPLVVPIPSAVVDDAGKQLLARVDLVLRVDGVDVTAEGAPACRSAGHSRIGRDPAGAVGSFDERALSACLRDVLSALGDKRAVGSVTRAGGAVPTTYVDALVAVAHRAGIADVTVAP